MTPIVIAARTHNAWLAISLIALAAGAHQGWSANIYTLASDMFPRSAVGVGRGLRHHGRRVQRNVGGQGRRLHSATHWFLRPRVRDGGLAYLVALGFVQVLAPRLKPAQV